MEQYHQLLQDILTNGELKNDRTSVGTYSVFGRSMRFNLRTGFPAITTKKLAWKSVVGELLWFLEGSSDERRLAEITHGTRENVTTIWTPNALAPYWKKKAKFDGDLGRIYGAQWRTWKSVGTEITYPDKPYSAVYFEYIDQIKNLIRELRENPHSRRHILNAWNPGELSEMALPPCHVLSQYYVNTKNEMSCQVYIRSNDMFLGAPFNIASYALLTHMIAQVCSLSVGELIITIGDAHIYVDHLDQVKEQLSRDFYPLPKLWLNPLINDIDKFTMEDIKLIDYVSHGQLKANMAV